MPRSEFNQRRHQMTATVDTELEARRIEADYRRRAQRAKHGADDPTLAEVVGEWWGSVPKLAATSRKNYRDNLDNHIIPSLGARPVAEIRPRLVGQFLRHLSEDKGLGPATVRKVRTILSAVMAYAVSMEYTESNPVMKVAPPALTGDERPAPTLEETARILMVAEADPAFLTYLWVAAESGGRRGEVLGLRWSSLDFDAGTMTIRHTVSIGDDGVKARPRTKSGKPRTIALSRPTLRHLLAHRQRVSALLTEVSGRATEPKADAWVFSDRDLGLRPWRPDSTSRKFRLCKERAGVDPEVDLHGLRRTMISELLAADVDPKTVMGRAGHKTERVTMEVYARARPPIDAAASELYGALLEAEVEKVRGLGAG